MTKRNTRNEYVRRIGRAIEFIAENIDQRINFEKIAQASHFSPFHFHRIFHGIVGESVNDYVSRKKMERSAGILICKPDLSITQVAEMGGFSSNANFAKSFKLYFGITPSQLRDPAAKNNSKTGKIYSKYGKVFNAQDLYSQFVTQSAVFDPDKLEEMLMNVKVEDVEEKQIAYLTAPKGYELDAIFETWDKLAKWAGSHRAVNDGNWPELRNCRPKTLQKPALPGDD